ncbi:MAG: hypothetical protein PHO23_00100 [Candidatus Pacebacteria bacterium]|nr:hypothetical protein [Candidatus Paceibacterota bacterium]
MKTTIDNFLRVYQMANYFHISQKNKLAFSDYFYGEFYSFFNEYRFNEFYNAIKNFLTKKENQENKIKLNFDCGTLLSGFDKNKEKDNLGIILRKKQKYYLGILVKGYTSCFEDKNLPKEGTDYYEKMTYKLFPGAFKMIPKIAWAPTNQKLFNPSDQLKTLRQEYKEYQDAKKTQKNNKIQFSATKLAKLIEYYQKVLQLSGHQSEFNLQ